MNLAKTLETPGICRLAVAAAAVASAVCADGAITSQSYVAPGLVAQYDGIDNAGVGVHDDSAVTWVDLTGNGYDGTVTNAVGWLADGWTNSVNCKPVTLGNGISAITATGLYTIQFACTPARDDVRECFFSQYDSNIKSIGIEHNANGNTQGYLRFYSNAEGVGYLAQTQPFLKDAWAQGSITVTNGTKKVGFWKNGELLQSNTFESTDQKTYDACPSVIGGEPNTGRDMAFRGTYNAFRLYNRVLTEEEMKLNYAVDSVRFNGADWSDYPEFAGYTFDANGLLTVNFAVSADGNGTVSVNGGAAGASFADSFAYDGAAHEYAVTATADTANDYKFCRWTGDTSAIAGGTCLDASIVVSSAHPVSLTAVFMKPRTGLTGLSYVSDGLVAAYDGVFNAGAETHDPNAATWVDLTGNGNDGTVDTSAVTWGDKGWSVSGDCKPVTLGNGISAVTASGEYTIQFACKPDRINKRGCFFSQYNGSAVNGVGVENDTSGYMRFYSAPQGAGLTGNATGGNFSAGEWAQGCITVSNSTKNIGFWKNGVFLKEATYSSDKTYASECSSVIGGEPWASSNRDGNNFDEWKMAFRGTYNAFRLYDRALTADEIAVNAAVDAVRFNGASASSYTLPGGYSFAEDAELDHALMVGYSAVAGAGGKVMIDGGEYAASASKAMNADGSDSATFAAKANAGYEFDFWTGDVDAIISGTTNSLVVNVNSAAPVTLTANFRSALPYIANVTAEQDPISRQVKVTYKLTKDPGVVTLNIETNSNPGGTASYVSVATQNVTHVSGDVNKFVDKAGETCTVWWQPDKSWPGQLLEGVRIRVEGWQEDSARLYCAVNTNNGDRAYYKADCQIPDGIRAVSEVRQPYESGGRSDSAAAVVALMDTVVSAGDAMPSASPLATRVKDWAESAGQNLRTALDALVIMFK